MKRIIRNKITRRGGELVGNFKAGRQGYSDLIALLPGQAFYEKAMLSLPKCQLN